MVAIRDALSLCLPASPKCTLLSEDPGLLPRPPFLEKGFRTENRHMGTRASRLMHLSGLSILTAKFREGQGSQAPWAPTGRSPSFRVLSTLAVTNAAGSSALVTFSLPVPLADLDLSGVLLLPP